METSLNHTPEKIKNNINGTGVESEQLIQELIEASNKRVYATIDNNKKIIDSIKKEFNEQGIEDTISCAINYTFGKSIELAEDTLDSIIDSYTKQMKWNIDFNTKLVDAIADLNNQTPEKILNLIHENFESSRQLTINSTKEMLDFYNKHANLAVNFNNKFGETINAQMEALFSLNSSSLNTFTEWTSKWWKQNETEVNV
jgi:hypothetical protein